MTRPLILDGRALAKEALPALRARAGNVFTRMGKPPVMAAVLAGGGAVETGYANLKARACEKAGVELRKIILPQETTTNNLLAVLDDLNADADVDGVLLQHPTPGQVNEAACFNRINPAKDIDGVNALNFDNVAVGLPGFNRATPAAVMAILTHYSLNVAGRCAVVIGNDYILGQPLALLLKQAGAAVTLCCAETPGLADITRRADIVAAAVGKPKFVKAGWIKEGAVIIDCGYHPCLCGDVDLAEAAPKTSAYTPVPGGVGPMTIIKLIEHTIIAAERVAQSG